MKFIKSKLFYFLIGVILSGSMVYAATTISASNITYTDKNNVEKTVDVVLDDLYDKANSQKTATQVTTLTTQGASYTMQNDGYITGTASSSEGKVATIECSNNKTYILTNESYTGTRYVSLYIEKGVTVNTRPSSGTYSLTVYEWK